MARSYVEHVSNNGLIRLIQRHRALGALTVWLFASAYLQAPAQEDPAAISAQPSQGEWGDQGNGAYVNPIMPADFSDLDAIRVGRDYYAISSTFQYSPGVVVLHSNDLVNWQIIGHAVDDITRISPEMNWDRMNRAGRGIWAGSIRYHEGKYWIYFGTPDEGFFVTTAANPAGPWTAVANIMPAAGWDDPCPFWDDDGQGYFVATHFERDSATGKTYTIHLFKLSADGQHLATDSDRVIHQSRGSEANKLYKINGTYYHYFSEVHDEGRVIMMGRAKSLAGPWETRQLIHVSPSIDKEPNQGGLVQIPSGKWYFVSHQGKGDWEGRAGVLLPVTWIEGWPVIGRVGPDGIGNMQWGGDKPIRGFPLTSVAASDNFRGKALKPEWEWNYQPRPGSWSLSERSGFLRLHAFRPLRANDFRAVGNVLTQRSIRSKRCEVTIRLDLSGLLDTQEAGLAHFAKTFCTLSVQQSGTARRLIYNNNGQTTVGPRIGGTALWLRSTWNFAGASQFSYSTDGNTYQSLGDPYQLSWGFYRGDRIGIYTCNQRSDAGYLDVANVRYDVER